MLVERRLFSLRVRPGTSYIPKKRPLDYAFIPQRRDSFLTRGDSLQQQWTLVAQKKSVHLSGNKKISEVHSENVSCSREFSCGFKKLMYGKRSTAYINFYIKASEIETKDSLVNGLLWCVDQAEKLTIR